MGPLDEQQVLLTTERSLSSTLSAPALLTSHGAVSPAPWPSLCTGQGWSGIQGNVLRLLTVGE